MNRTVITGIGVVSSIGIGVEEFWRSIKAGASAFSPISMFDIPEQNGPVGAEARTFEPRSILGPKGLRTLDRTTQLACAAARLALDDAGCNTDDGAGPDTGFVLGTSMGSVRSIAEFDRVLLSEGFMAVNPMQFPNTVPNSPAGHGAIRFNLTAFNTTISTGYTSGLDSIIYGVNAIRKGRARRVLAGAAEDLCQELYYGYYLNGLLADAAESRKGPAPFNKRPPGIVLGEGSAFVLLESAEEAHARGAKVYGQVLGYGMSFDVHAKFGYNPRANGAADAMRRAFISAGVQPQQIDTVYASANSSPICDRMEARAIRLTNLAKADVCAIKSMTGECHSASGALQVSAALGGLSQNFVPPTVSYKADEPACPLKLSSTRIDKQVSVALINSFAYSGNNTCLILADREFKPTAQ